MAGISKEELSARRQRLLDELPNHGWDYAKAGVAAGYSPAYARTHLKTHVTKDSNFCQQVSAKRAEIDAQQVDKREKALRSLWAIADDPGTSARDKVAAIKEIGAVSGWHSERHILETPQRQRQLDQAAREEAQRLALLRHDTRRLPAAPLASVQTDQQAVDEPTPAQECA